MKKSQFLLFLGVILVTFVIRFYQLDKVPPEINIDEASQGYNAFSILKTGEDRYGKSFPILFRSFDSFQAPLYTYLTIIPVYFFGNSILSVHFIAALSGVLLALITLIFIIKSDFKEKGIIAFLVTIFIAISPWAVFFSRVGAENGLGLTIFSFSILLFYLSLKKRKLFIFACIILGISTHAYYSERLISILFLPVFIFLFRKTFLKSKQYIIAGLLLFALILVPHLIIANTGALTKRINQVEYFSDQYFISNSGSLKEVPLGKIIFIFREFVSQYSSYWSPKNLFFDPDPQIGRSIPDLSVFYNWMIIPFIFGFIFVIKNVRTDLIKTFLLVLIISLIPAALTRDAFNTTRTLVFLWVMTILIGFGCYELLKKIKDQKLQSIFVSAMIIFSLFSFYISYFVLLKYERAENAYASFELLDKIKNTKDEKFVVDAYRDLSLGIRYAYLLEHDPRKIQSNFRKKIDNYYSNSGIEERYNLDNMEIRPIIWKEDLCSDKIIIGDYLSISDQQVREHALKFIFDVKDRSGRIIYWAYKTDPNKCLVKR